MSTTNLQTKYKINIFTCDKKGIIKKNYFILTLIIFNKIQKKSLKKNSRLFKWTHQGSNLGPPDYESGALTN